LDHPFELRPIRGEIRVGQPRGEIGERFLLERRIGGDGFDP
jgi:hypothetical protein